MWLIRRNLRNLRNRFKFLRLKIGRIFPLIFLRKNMWEMNPESVGLAGVIMSLDSMSFITAVISLE